MSAYAIALLVHSYLRWVVFFAGILLGVRSFTAWRGKRSWQSADERLHLLFVATFDTQFTIGLVLYFFFSPLPPLFFANFGGAIQDPTLRFFGMEHGLAMFVAAAVVHAGRVQSRRRDAGAMRHRSVWISTLLALFIVAAAIPWPGPRHGRPLFRAGHVTGSLANNNLDGWQSSHSCFTRSHYPPRRACRRSIPRDRP